MHLFELKFSFSVSPAVLLLCAVGALSDDGKTPPCVPSYEVRAALTGK